MTYLVKRDAEKILYVMNRFPDQEAFLLETKSSSGIGTTITLTLDVIHNSIPGKFVVEIAGSENW